MLKIFSLLLLVVLIAGCGDSTDFDSSDPVKESSNLESDRLYHGNVPTKDGCDGSTINSVVINGNVYLVEIPSVCKVDPLVHESGPEFTNPLDNNDFMTRKDILLRINTQQ